MTCHIRKLSSWPFRVSFDSSENVRYVRTTTGEVVLFVVVASRPFGICDRGCLQRTEEVREQKRGRSWASTVVWREKRREVCCSPVCGGSDGPDEGG